MKRFISIAGIRIFPFLFLVMKLSGQTAANEDKDLLTVAKARDQKAIAEAKNGWWTESMKIHEQRIGWWRDAKFGMFIHWGIYSVAGGEWKGKKVSGYAEHLMRKETISRQEYLQLAKQFNPARFNAEEWIMHAKKAGMKYFIITAKHHDGFALFDSKVSDFNVVDQTPFKRDPMAELAAACKKHGMKFGFYYSHAFDWENANAPGNDWEFNNPGGDKLLGGANWYDLHPEWLPKAVKYVNEKAIPQIKELLTKYNPDILWFDTPQKLPLSENIRILQEIRELDPNVVVNGRLVRDKDADFGDYQNTADRPAEFYPVIGDWEAIPTTNESYGYHQYDHGHKPAAHFIRLLATAVSRGGNLLMNMGPKGDGSFDTNDLNILAGIGNWMEKNQESIHAGRSALAPQSWGVSTSANNKVYLHIFNWPADGKLYIGGLKTAISKAYLLAAPSTTINSKKINDQDIYLTIPKKAPDTVNTVIVLELKDKIQANPVRYISSNIQLTRLLAYDALQRGGGFNFGDGKSNRYFVEGWKTTHQSLSWTVRAGEDHMYRVMIKYIGGKEASGELQLRMDDSYEFGYTINKETESRMIDKELAELNITEGTHTITLQPISITGSELMKILEIQLIPIDN